MNQTPTLSAKRRERVGSRYAQRCRKLGQLPAIIYGHGATPLPVMMDAHETLRHINKGEKVFTMTIEGESASQTVLLKDLGFDYLGSNIIHADFARVDLNERVHTKVHVNLVGEAKGLKIAGNILMHPTTELVIECRVVDIPDHVDVDINELDLGHAITAGEVKLPKADMKLISDPHLMVAQIVVQLEVKTDEATTVAAEGAEPEVITAKKAEGEEGAAPAKGAAPAAKGAPAAAKGAAPAKEEKKK